ncbi:MAG: NAD-binding protein [Bacteroidota bacterium]
MKQKRFYSLRNKFFLRLFLAIGMILFAILTGTVGFYLIEGYSVLKSVYVTVVTLSTIGYDSPTILSDEAKIFSIFLIFSNLGIFAYAISSLSSFFTSGEYRIFLKKQNMLRKIEKLNQHIIVIGFGRNGKQVCEELLAAEHPFVVVEKNPRTLEALEAYGSILFTAGDATRDEVLKLAGIDHACTLISCLPNDADNVFVVLTAKVINPKIHVISRASDDHSEIKLKHAGADQVIMPEKIGGAHMASLVLKPNLMDLVSMLSGPDCRVSFEEYTFDQIKDEFQNKKVSEVDVWNRTGASLIGLRDPSGRYFINPSSTMEILPGSQLIFLGTRTQLVNVKEKVAK